MRKGKKSILLLSSLLLLLGGCGTVKYVPVEKVVKETIRDTIILRPDTVKIEIPKEVIRETLPALDTSVVETSVARAVAYLDTARRAISHSLENKEVELEKEIVIQEKIVYKDRVIEQEIPKEVTVMQPFVPSWAYWMIGIGWGLLILIVFIHFKF